MEREPDNFSAEEEFTPFLQGSLQRKYEVRSPQRRALLTYCLTALLSVSLCFHVLTFLYLKSASYLDAICILHTQQSPSTIDIPIHFHTVRYDGTFLANKTTIYRLPPSPAVDAAWEGLGTTSQPLLLAPSEASRAGISLDHLKTPSGDFPVYFEFNHHLHCLNMVRKSVFFNYPYYSDPDAAERHLGADDQTVRKHVTHCLDMLRQQLQCKPDLGVFGQFWVRDKLQGIDGPFVDFNTNHKCIDWEAVRGWVQTHKSTGKVEVEFKEGDRILDIAP